MRAREIQRHAKNETGRQPLWPVSNKRPQEQAWLLKAVLLSLPLFWTDSALAPTVIPNYCISIGVNRGDGRTHESIIQTVHMQTINIKHFGTAVLTQKKMLSRAGLSKTTKITLSMSVDSYTSASLGLAPSFLVPTS